MNFRGIFVPAHGIQVTTDKDYNIVDDNYKSLIEKQGYLVIKADRFSAESLASLFKSVEKKSTWPRVPIEFDIKYARKDRTLDQNRLYWALINILAYEKTGEYGWEDQAHEYVLDTYAPRIHSKFTGKAEPMRSSHMNTIQFAELIDAVFNELAQLEIPVHHQTDIRSYWAKHMEHKYSLDSIEVTEKTIEEYRRSQTFCEACTKPLLHGTDNYEGNIAHIVSKGAGGSDAAWNLFHFCVHDHLEIQHQNGWEKLIEQYPHIRGKYEHALNKFAEMQSETKNLDLF